ncbi:MAG: TolC family protein [Chromatiales bacterium]|jgi:outer membrane protein TolC|nr:TolC family protein [Chromatiales bacterium]
MLSLYRWRQLGFVALCVQTSFACAQNFLPPSERVRDAIEAYAEVRAANASIAQAEQQARELAAGPNEFQLSLSPTFRRTTDPEIANSNDTRFTEWEAQLSRTIRLPGKAALDRETGAHIVTAAKLRFGDAEHQAARNLLAAWMGWLRAEAVSAAAQTQYDTLARERDTIARRLALGDAAARELDQIDAMQATVRAQLFQAKSDVAAQRLILAMNFPQITVPERAPELPDPAPLDDTPENWIDRIISGSHEIGVLTATAAEHDTMARRAAANRLPDPTVGIRTFNEFGGAEKGWGVVVSVPIGMTRRDAEARSQFAAANIARSETEAMRRDITSEATLTLARAQLSLQMWQAAHAARLANATSLSRQHRAYELGEISLAERLQVERLDAEAALTELRARVDAHEALLRVKVDGHAIWDWD